MNAPHRPVRSLLVLCLAGLLALGAPDLTGAASRDGPQPPRGLAVAGYIDGGDQGLTTGVIDPVRGYAYFGDYTNYSEGIIERVRLADFVRTDHLFLGYYSFPVTSVIDPADGYAYFGGDFNPARIFKIALDGLWVADVMALEDNVGSITCSTIDTMHGIAYFGTDTGRVASVRLSDFTRGQTVTLPWGLTAAVIDPYGQYGYFATGGGIGKVRLVDMHYMGAMYTTGGPLRTAAVDSAGHYAYLATDAIPAHVIKVDLPAMTQVDDLTLDAGEATPYALVIDDATDTGYVGPGYDRIPRIVQFRLSDMTRLAAVDVPIGESITSAVIDGRQGYAYFGTQTYMLAPWLVRVSFRADLGMHLSAAPNPVPAGTPLTYAIDVGNPFGPNDATGVQVTLTLPPSATFIAASEPGCSPAGGVVTCALGSVPSGTARTVRVFTVAPAGTGTITATAQVGAVTPDGNPDNNNGAVVSTVVPFDVCCRVYTPLALHNFGMR